MKYLCVVICSIILLGCSNSQNNFPVIIDFYPKQDSLFFCNLKQYGNYNILYIGKYYDSIKLEKIPTLEPYWNDYRYSKKFKKPEKQDIEIKFDLNQSMAYRAFRYFFYEINYEQEVLSKGFPVMVKNISQDTMWVSNGEKLRVILEAIDREGNWKPIQSETVYMDNNGLNQLYLPPQQIIIFTAPQYLGSYKTKLRFKLYESVSPIFEGCINENQFYIE